jgi:lipoprotein NlpD
MKRIFAGLIVVAMMAGCASSGHRAPVVEHGAVSKKSSDKLSAKSTDKDWRPKVHVVQKGDTLFAIAFNYGLDPRELAELNGIQDPNLIQVGQQIKLFPGTAAPVTESRPAQSSVKDQPKVVKYPYSEAAVAKAEALQGDSPRVPVIARIEAKPEAKAEARPEAQPASLVAAEDALEWSMPTQGKLIGSFSEADNRKGIDIAGKLGQPIFASAPGKVVYSGSGLRGYGKLLIIKHNKTYLSAYAHNDQLLVKEGETVTRGQKIAEMGNTDSDQVKLHFEVRRLGRPVDPANYLSLNKP